MGNPTLLIFIAVAEKELKLPIKNWTEDLGNFLQKAYDSRPESGLYIVGGGKGNQFYDILDIRDRFNLEGLDFLSSECATLQGLELVSAIHSLTIIIDELFTSSENLQYTFYIGKNKEEMLVSFKESTIDRNVSWDDNEYALFSRIKALIYVMSDALANNKIFVFINYIF